MNFKYCFDKIVVEFSTGKYRQQIEKAKQEFFALSGTVHEENREYQDRINLFLDWYIFERQLDEEDLKPLEMYLFLHGDKFSEEEKDIFEGMKRSISSLFMVKKLGADSVKVKDLFIGKSYNVEDDSFLSFAHKGDLFQGRIVPVSDKYNFGLGFCFHNPDTEGYIKKEIKKIKNMDYAYHVNLMMKLALMKVKTEEYPHVPIKNVYSEKPTIRF